MRRGTDEPIETHTLTTSTNQRKPDLSPAILMKIKKIQGRSLGRPLIALCDSGSTGTMINSDALPFGTVPNQAIHKQLTTTACGSFDSSMSVLLEDIQLPEFVNGRHIRGVQASLFHLLEIIRTHGRVIHRMI